MRTGHHVEMMRMSRNNFAPTEFRTCPICNGDGAREMEDHKGVVRKYDCDSCDGMGTIKCFVFCDQDGNECIIPQK